MTFLKAFYVKNMQNQKKYIDFHENASNDFEEITFIKNLQG